MDEERFEIMKKITLLSFIILVVIIIFVFANKSNIGKSLKSDSKEEKIKHIVEELIKIQYKKSNKELKDIATEEFLHREDKLFYQDSVFYSYNENFIDTYREIENGLVAVNVLIYDDFGQYYQEIRLESIEGGFYLVSEILRGV